MMQTPLTIHHLIERAALLFSHVEVVSQTPAKALVRHTYADIYRRARGLAFALQRSGLNPGDRVATLMWNHHVHMEAYFGVPMVGGVYHTLNPRLSPEDMAYVIDHAADRYIIVDDTLFPLIARIRDRIDLEKVIVVGWNEGALPNGCDDYRDYGDAVPPEGWSFPEVSEDAPVGICYTSGTTGTPKGVVYSHRAIVLHSFASALPDALNLSQSDTLCPVVPMFHVNAWGLPFTAAMTGSKLVYPGPHLDPEALLNLYVEEKVNVSAGVPTIWMGILKLMEADPERWTLSPNMRMIVGGAAAPVSMIEHMGKYGMYVVHAWGMTETTPLGTVSNLQPRHVEMSEEERLAIRAKQGLPSPFVEVRALDDEGNPVPWNGKTMGELQARGPWIAAGYHLDEQADEKWTEDGWFRTGDVVTIDAGGYIEITDRTKDLVKSGGEWISSVALENALMGHADVAEAAVVAVPDSKWGERPVAVVVARDGRTIDESALRAYLGERFEKFWLPDAFEVRDSIPRGATGKFLKRQLREELRPSRGSG
ncbi:MAG: long-chain fatty acid--CoA ligase [Myxococcota bacterium]